MGGPYPHKQIYPPKTSIVHLSVRRALNESNQLRESSRFPLSNTEQGTTSRDVLVELQSKGWFEHRLTKNY